MRRFQTRFILCAITAALLLGTGASAAPFEKTVRFVQPDGAAIELWGKGDEFHAVFETLDGYTVVFDPASKAYVYAARSADGTDLVQSAVQVGKGDPAALGFEKHLRMSPAVIKAKARARFERWDLATKNSERWRERKAALRAAESVADGRTVLSPPAFTTTGTKVGLCLLIDFSDDVATIPRADIIDFCNGDDYTGYGNNGSVKKYFQDNSDNLLTYTNIVTVYIRMAQPKTYYNDTTKDCGEQGNLLIKDAVAIMKALPNYATEIAPAFAGLTVDVSGYVQACNVFYAGGDGGVWAYGLWPHSWGLYSVGEQTLTATVKLMPYQITNIGASLELGTFCHENGHMLCDYPDIYDYGYDSTGGAGAFCLMNSGGFGTNPSQVCAYLKRASGWATTVDLTGASSLTAVLASGGEGFNRFYRYAKPGAPTEYYLLENRQQSGRDASIPASGLAVWHIDELGDRDNQSLAYNSSHANYEVTLVQADNQWHFQNGENQGDESDLYYGGNPAAGYLNLLADASAPSARWWDGTASGLALSAFSASGETMTVEVGSARLVIVTASPLPSGFVGVSYSQTLNVIGGAAPYTWSVVSNALPAGLSLSGGGLLGGTPEAAGTSVFQVRVTDATNAAATATMSLTVDAPRSVPFTETFEHGGSLPPGWTQEYVEGAKDWVFQSGGAIGQPPSAHGGSYNACFNLFGYDTKRTRLVSPMLDLGASPTSPLLTFWHCMENWQGDQDWLFVYYKTSAEGEWTLLAEYYDNTPDWTLRVLELPEVSRTFFIAFEGVTRYGYGVCVDDVTVTASPTAPFITTSGALPSGTLGVPYSQALSAMGGKTPYTWAVVSNTLPPGLTLSGGGVISGTPGAVTNAFVRIRVAGSNGLASTNLFNLPVLPPRALPFIETFECAGLMPDGWTQEHVTDTLDWSFRFGSISGTPSYPHGGYYNACLFYENYGAVTRLVSPKLDLGAVPQNVQLSFWHCMGAWSGDWGTDQDELRVYYKTTAGGAWNLLAEYTEDTPNWTRRTVALPESSRYLFIAFEGAGNYGFGACIDDVMIRKATPYAAWLSEWFTETEMAMGGIAGASDDPDGDRVGNLLEYALCLNPWAPDATGLPVGGVWSRYLMLSYRQNKQATDLVYEVEACTNLVGALWSTNHVTEISRTDSNQWWQVTERHNVPVTNAPSRFMRLKVTLP